MFLKSIFLTKIFRPTREGARAPLLIHLTVWVPLHRYLTMKIMEEGASQMIECPGDCKIIVDDKMV